MKKTGMVVAIGAAGALAYLGSSPAETSEVRRIRAHFDSVVVELRSRDLSDLSAVQRGNRAAAIETLMRYRDRGVFPHNYDFPAQAMPYFVDRKTGTLCAVAHLLESTGRRDIVDRVSRMNNNVWVAQLAADSSLGGWLETNGLTLAEAARIQVPYMDPRQTEEVRALDNPRRTWTQAMVAPAAAMTVVNLLSNTDGHGRIRNALGFASGALAASFGAVTLADSRTPKSISTTNVAVGASSMALATWSFLKNRQLVAAKLEAERARVAISPTVAPKDGAGVAVTIRF